MKKNIVILIALILGVSAFIFFYTSSKTTIPKEIVVRPSMTGEYYLPEYVEEEEELKFDQIEREGFEFATLREYKEHYFQSMDAEYESAPVPDSIAHVDYHFIADYQVRQLKDSSEIEGIESIKEYVEEHFALYGLSWVTIPSFSTHGTYEIAESDTLVRIIPLKEKVSVAPHYLDIKSECFLQPFDFLLQNRTNFNLYNIYCNSKWLVHYILDYKHYSKNFEGDVNRLLVVYNDIVSKPILMHTLANEMLQHQKIFVKNLEYNSDLTDYDGFEKNLIPLLDEEIVRELGLHDISYVVYTYSFWLRRYYEGNMDDVYKTLQEIQSDYAILSDGDY